ncbi:hypothetical protein X943_003317 [Babesia divergens]|uniref:Non-specific serine/threonine protein kinase n=1 Tax=Babesia divergens TaxID=32595 RepID=A0AAD9G7S1_BABDI|nr:hypothetical protein X943_003317 [Babesia divergens]
MLSRTMEEATRERAGMPQQSDDNNSAMILDERNTTGAALDCIPEVAMEAKDIAHNLHQLLSEVMKLSSAEQVDKIINGFHIVKSFIYSRERHDELEIRALQCVADVINWKLPDGEVAREIIEVAFHTIAERKNPSLIALALKILGNLIIPSRQCSAYDGFEALFEAFTRVVDEGYVDKDENVAKLTALSEVFDLLIKDRAQSRHMVKILPKVERYFANNNIENHEFNHVVIKVTCQALMNAAFTEMTKSNLQVFTRNVFNAIAKLLPETQTYPQRASLMSCITLLARSGANRPLLREITEGDLLIRLNEGWQHEAMVGSCIVSVFIECINNMEDEAFTEVADNCLRLYNVYSSTDDYQMRERLIMLLYVFSKKMKVVYDTLKEKDAPLFQRVAEVLLHKATHEIQGLNASEDLFNDIGFVTFVRSTMPALINMIANCVATLSSFEPAGKTRMPALSNEPTNIRSATEESVIQERDGTVVMVEEEKLSVTATEDDDDPQLPDSKRPLTQIECLEICKSMCCIYEAGSTANELLREQEGEGVINDALLQLYEIKAFIRLSLKVFVGSFRPTALRQWIKLMIPVVFVMSLKDRFVLTVFDCFHARYAEIFAPHMLTFILQILKNQDNAIEYLKNVVAYSEGVLGLFSLNKWEPCSKRLADRDNDALLDLVQAVANHMFGALSDVPEAITACQNEIMYLTTAVSKLPATKSDRHITVATSMFKGINKVNDYSPALLILRVPIDVIVRKVVRGGARVHRDWLELMMATVARGPFTPDLVIICAKPALCILRDFKWDLVTAALEMLESWSEYLSPTEFYNSLSQIVIYKHSNVQPQFIECLSKYLQDEKLPNFKRNARIVMNIFSKMGSCAMKYVRDLPIKHDIPYTIVIPVNTGSGVKEKKAVTESNDAPSPGKWASPRQSFTSDEESPEDVHDQMSRTTASERQTEYGDDISHDTSAKTTAIGISVIDGLNSVIHQMSLRGAGKEAFEGSTVFVINAVSPMLNFDVSLSEAWLKIASMQPNNSSKIDHSVSYHTPESTREFVNTLMHAVIMVAAVGRRMWKHLEVFEDLEMMLSALARYLVLVSKTRASDGIDVSLDPTLVLNAVADRLLITWEQPEYNFDLPYDHIDPMEADVAVDFLLDVFTEAKKIDSIKLCNTIITMLCLGCNSHYPSKKMGACTALGRICNEHADILKPMVIDIANSVAQLCNGHKRELDIMKNALDALLRVNEPVIIQWAASLLEHPLWYLRTVGQMCLRTAKNREEVASNLQKINEVASTLQTPDVQMFLAIMENGDLSLIDLAISAMQPYMQSIAESVDMDEMFRAQADLYLELVGQLLTNTEYAKAAEEVEETVNHVAVYFIKLLIIGSLEIAEKANQILGSSVNVTVTPKILSMALEEYIFQLQTIFDETLLDRILNVVKKYRDVVDEALTESLFNVAKALVEGTLSSSVNDEYKNAHFIDYMIFLASIGAGRACSDVILGQWFTTIDCLIKGVIIPGSVAYGIWQVLSYDGVIYSVFKNAIKVEYINFLYFVSGKADVDYILWNGLNSLGTENHVTNLLYISLISWLCEDNMKLVSDSKHYKKLVDTMLKASCDSNTQVDDLLTAPFEIDNDQIMKWKVPNNCATVLFRMLPMATLQTKLSGMTKHKAQHNDQSKLDQMLTTEFIQRYDITTAGGMLNPIIGGHIFEMRNYQLKHLLVILHTEVKDKTAAVLDEIVDFCWQSLYEGDAMGKLLAICCLAKVVDLFCTSTVGAVAVFRQFVDILVSEDVCVFLNTHYTIRLDIASSDGKKTSTLMQLMQDSATSLIKSLCGAIAPPELLKAMKELTLSNNSKPSLWLVMLLSKINEQAHKPQLLVPLIAIFILHLHEDISMVSTTLMDVVREIDACIVPWRCNVVQGGAVDAFFGILAVADKNGLDMDTTWMAKACVKHIHSCVVSNHMDLRDVEPYLPLVVKLFLRSSPFDILSNSLKQGANGESHMCRFNQSHLFQNDSYAINTDDSSSNGKRTRQTQSTLHNGLIGPEEKRRELELKRYQKGAAVILDILDRALDHVIPDETGIRHITDILANVWYIKNAHISRLLQSCLFKLCFLLKKQFANTGRPLSNANLTPKVGSLDGNQNKDRKTTGCGGSNDLGCSVADGQNDSDVMETYTYLEHFPKWLISIVVEEVKAAKNVPPQKLEPEEQDELSSMICRYLDTTAITYVESPNSAPISSRNTPTGSLAAFSRMASSTFPENNSEGKTDSDSEIGSGFSTALRSLLTMLKALSDDAELMLQVLTDVLPAFLGTLQHSLEHVPDVEFFTSGKLRVHSTLYVLPADSCHFAESDKDYDKDGSKRVDQLLAFLLYILPIVGGTIKQEILKVTRMFTLALPHPYNKKILKLATEVIGADTCNSMDIDGTESNSLMNKTPRSPCLRKMRNTERMKTKRKEDSPVGRNANRKGGRVKDKRTKDSNSRVKQESQDSEETSDCIDDIQEGFKTTTNGIRFISVEGSSKETVKWADLKNWIKGSGKSYPKHLLEKGESKEVSVTLIPMESNMTLNVYTRIAFAELLQSLKLLYNECRQKDAINLEIIYAIRNLAHHDTLWEEYYEAMLDCIEASGYEGSSIKNQLIVYISCVSEKNSAFMDAYEELKVPSDLFSIMKYVLSSEISCNRDNGLYIPLYLDVIFTCALDDWGLSVTDNYPTLPALVYRDVKPSLRQIDLICRDEFEDSFKPGVLLLKEFKNMETTSNTKDIADDAKKPLSFELVDADLTNINCLLQRIHQYYVVYFDRIANTANFKECLRKLWHGDREFATKVWASVFPQFYDTLTKFQQEDIGNTVCRYLCREEHLYNRSGICQAILTGAIQCYPPIHIPPEVLKYLAVTFGLWYEVAYHLEKQILSQPLEITRMATVLSDIYERLNMNDMSIGAYRTWVITQETRLALCFLQHAKWKQAQREFNSVMESLALTGQTAEAVSSFDESKIWYSGWVNASKQLGEWDLLRDVSFVSGDKKLFLQASTTLQDWGDIVPEDGLNDISMIFALDDAECKIDKVYQQLHTDLLPLKELDNDITHKFIVNSALKAEKCIGDGKTKVLESWLLLPKGLSEAHMVPMQVHQRFVEVEEGMKYLTDVMRGVERGKIPESAPILSKWRKRMPRPDDMPSVWNSMLSWRTFMFSSVRNMLINAPTISSEAKLKATINLQDLQWTMTKFASVTRKCHQLPLVASVILNKVQKFHKSILDQSNVVTEDCFLIMIERIKQYLDASVNTNDVLKGVLGVDLNLLPSAGCESLKSHVTRLIADVTNRKAPFDPNKRTNNSDNDIVCKYMLDALKLEPMISKNWISWARYNDKRIDRAAATQGRTGDGNFQSELYESAILGYLTAVSIRPHNHWLLLGRVLTLLNELKGVIKTGTASDAFKKYCERIPASVWLLWLPQLIFAVNRGENVDLQHVLQLLMYRLPQQVFYALRCEYFAQNSTGDSDNGTDNTQPGTMKRLLSSLIASNPSVGTMLESFTATVTHLGRPDFVDEVLCTAETIFEECLDLPFNEKMPPQMLNFLTMKISHRSSIGNDGENETYITQMMKDFDGTNGTTTCGESMNRLLKWISKLREISKMAHADKLQQQINHMKMHQFCQNLQMLNLELQLPTLQPSISLLNPKQRHCLGECVGVVSLLPEVKKRQRGMHILKSISILAQNGQVYVYAVQPLSLARQKSDQHISQMFNVFNHYALKFNETRRRDVMIPTTRVVSLDPYLCLYEDDAHGETLSTIYEESTSYKNLVKEMPDMKSYIHSHPSMCHETNMLLLILHKMMMEIGVTQHLLQRWQQFNPDCKEELSFTRVYQLFKEKQYPWFTTWYKKTHQDVLMEAYSQICALIPDDLLLRHAMKRFDSYQDFMTMKRRLTSNYAIQALLGLMFVTPYAIPCKISLNFYNGQVKHLDFRLNYSREIFVEYSKLRVFRFTRNIKTMIGPVCRMGVMPAVMYALCDAIHTYKVDILGTLGAILNNDFTVMQSATEAQREKPETQSSQTSSQQHSQRSNSGSRPSTPVMVPKRDANPLDEYIGRVLNYCSYLRSPADQEQCSMPINNIICCIIDASADSGTLGKLKTSYQPWF